MNAPEASGGTQSSDNPNAGGVSSCDTPARVVLADDALDSLSADELRSHWQRQQAYIDSLESLNADHQGELRALRESEEKLKQQLSDLSLRERILVRRLAAKEQDMHEYAGQLSELKGGQAPSVGGLRSALVDPAVNVLISKLRQELAATRTRLDDTQNELAAWKFTPDSNTGKRLMAKCRLLYQENEELGRMVSSGRLAKLEGDLALQKSFSEEVKKSQSELDELLQDLDEDVEGMQSTIYYLQQELRKAKETAANLERENATLRGNSNANGEQQQPINGISVLQHNGKWCPSQKENPDDDLPEEPGRGGDNDNRDHDDDNDNVEKNERLTMGDDDTVEPTQPPAQDDSVIINKTSERTPNCADDTTNGPPPCKKPRTDHDSNTTANSTTSSSNSNNSLRYNNQQQTVITNGDVSTQ